MQSEARLTLEPEVPGSIPGPATYFRFSFRGFKKGSYQLLATYVLEALVNHLGWLFGCFGLNGPLRQYFSLYRAVSQREGERKEKR